MKRILYSNGSFLTGDQIAHALLEYATELARAETADLVHVPTLAEDGRPEGIDVVIGPASQLMAKDEPCSFDEPGADSFFDDLERRSATLTTHRPAIRPYSGPPASFFDDLDL